MKKLILALSSFLFSVVSAVAQTPYYQGKTIRIVTGYPAGDVNDLWPRLIAQHMGKYIPGNPNFIVQNMPGASSMIAANYVYSVAKPDGLTLGWIAPTLLDQPSAVSEIRWAKYSFIGSPAQSEHHLYMRADTPYKTIEDVRKASEPPKCGSGGATGTGYYFPKLLEETVAAKFNIVLGYQGGGPIDLAVEKGEIQCRAMTIESFMAREPFHTWRKNNFVRSLAQSAASCRPTATRHADDFRTDGPVQDPGSVAPRSYGDTRRWRLRPPLGRAGGIPPERLKILRSAVASALKDPELKAEAEKRNYELDPVGGDEMQRLAKEVMSQPPVVIERMRKVLGE
jgi:tripartite-type tricarboxylate transporter receptor subunit TctC